MTTNEEWIKQNIGTKDFDFAGWLVYTAEQFQIAGILQVRHWLKQEHKK